MICYCDFGIAMKNKPLSERVIRDLTAKEQKQLETARAEAIENRDAIIAVGIEQKTAWLAMRRDVQQTVDALRAERERLGLSLAAVEERCGLKRSALSRLENDPTANPTMLTLQRYAMALNMTITTTPLSLPGSSQ